ncbi:MAG TPA: cytochrome P450, partial [Solirubrobacterales bacterium]|nr:cytochrome P450 [Solirubrobacterales bacterium]
PMSVEQIRDEAVTLILAGHETTANALSWAAWLLGDRPELQQRIADEARQVFGERRPSANDCAALNFCGAVIREAMRLYPPAWLIGTAGLSVAKILENMEIGHNVMHGQWDWMRDPKIHSTSWEWDNASPADLWKHSHNEIHHTYTNVIGKDHDLGYGIMRVDEDQRWVPFYLGQPAWNLINAFLFEYSIAAYDLQLKKNWKGRRDNPEFQAKAKQVIRKIRAQMTKDYLVHPALSGPSAPTTFAANLTANLVRNLWTHSVIMCGHFPEGVATFEKASIEGETRADWYVRQMLGAANIKGSPAMHVMTGNLSFQIEHHLFPDLPSNRYQEISPKVREIFDRYDLPYAEGSLPRQVASAWKKVIRLSLPNDSVGKVKSFLGFGRKEKGPSENVEALPFADDRFDTMAA